MAQSIDLYSILASYANKNNSPFIDPEIFIPFLEGYAKKNSEEYPEWLKWAQDTGAKFWAELSVLAEEGKCELLHDTPNGRIYMPYFYQKLVEEHCIKLDDNADLPFPNEESLGIVIPENQLLSLAMGSEFTDYLEKPENNDLIIINICLPSEIPSVLVLSSQIPKRLIESCLFKIRNYLREHGNKDYAINKLTTQLIGKEPVLRDLINRIVIHPLDCYTGIVEGGEFSYLFWAHFCILVKNDIKKKKERISSEIAVLQAVFIIETLNTFYKAKATKERDKELAFKALEQNFAKPPYLYTMDEIIKFTSTKGPLLLGQYSTEELAERLEKMCTVIKDNKLPELLILTGTKKEQFYILKNKMLVLCNRLIIEAREKVKTAISKYWLKLLKNYQSEPAMENDKDFEKTLSRYTDKFCPMLNALLEDPKLQLVYDEMEQIQEVPSSCRIFNQGNLLPYSAIYLCRRKDLLEDTRILLPFWYSLPFLVAIAAFFKRLFTKKEAKSVEPSTEEDLNHEETTPDKSQEIINAAREIEHSMVPQHHSLDSYLDELKVRWVRLIDKKARENLVEDVNSLVRDNLRQTLRVQKHYKITKENVVLLADTILNRTPSLNSISAKDSLRTYIELYLVKLLENFKINFSINEAP